MEKKKDKTVKIVVENDASSSPYTLRWPKKQEKKEAPLQDPSQTACSIVDKRSPDLLFHPTFKHSVKGVTFFMGRPISFRRLHVVFFAALMLLVIVPFQIQSTLAVIAVEKQHIIDEVTRGGDFWKQGYGALQEGDFTDAQKAFANAETLFLDIASFPRKQHPVILSILETSPVKPKDYQAFKEGITAGYLISRAGNRVTTEAARLSESEGSPDAIQLQMLEAALHESTQGILEAHFLVSRIDLSVVPPSHLEEFLALRSLFDDAVSTIVTIDTLGGLLASMAGFDDPRLWLVVFQNNAELRASGGFMGSFGLAKVDNGELSIVDIPGGGTYDHRGSFRKNVVSPEPLHLINPVWEFQDSNWWPDWPTTAKKVMWFYEQGNGATVDGVVSFTPAFLERVLDITGPITLEGEYGFVIDKYNAYDVIQTLSERKQDITREPKKIIDDLARTILEQRDTLITSENIPDIISLVLESIEERQLLVYWNEPSGQQVLADNGWDGSLVTADTNDYLMVVHTNIAGGKSDRVIRDVVEVDSSIATTGVIKNTVTLTRTHHGKEGTGFSGVRNVDYIRFYVPPGSRLLSTEGFTKPDELLFEEPPEEFAYDDDYLAIETNKRYDDENDTEVFSSFGKTVFANWLMVDPGESRSVTLEYVLPETIAAMPEEFDFYIQKQSGWQGAQVDYTLSWPETWGPLLVNGSDPGSATSVTYQNKLIKDIHVTTIWDENSYAKK